MAMGVYGIGVVMAPDSRARSWAAGSRTIISWRWIFFINVPVGLLALLLIQRFIYDPPWIRNARPARLDVIGFGFMSLWLGCQEVLLDKGQEDDWFGSRFIAADGRAGRRRPGGVHRGELCGRPNRLWTCA